MGIKYKAGCVLLLLLPFGVCGQIDDYTFRRAIAEPTDQWHSIPLPVDIYQHLNSNLSDLRIFGITTNQDTIEAPYLLRVSKEKSESISRRLTLLNVSRKGKDHFYTFEIPSKETINRINLSFNVRNFDWKVQLEGSDDQHEWFTLLDGYRMVSIENQMTSFKFTELAFGSSNFRYYRLKIPSSEDPQFANAQLAMVSNEAGQYDTFEQLDFAVRENPSTKQTDLEVTFQYPSILSDVTIQVEDTIDYYRQVVFKVCTDSVETKTGMHYSFRTVTTGTLNSLSGNQFALPDVRTKKLFIEVHHQDNAPLNITSIEAKGEKRDMMVRLSEPANYVLAYGNASARAPKYDLINFTNKIPRSLSQLELGPEVKSTFQSEDSPSPLFENKWWLWGAMAIIVLLLGWFSIGMLKGK